MREHAADWCDWPLRTAHKYLTILLYSVYPRILWFCYILVCTCGSFVLCGSFVNVELISNGHLTGIRPCDVPLSTPRARRRRPTAASPNHAPADPRQPRRRGASWFLCPFPLTPPLHHPAPPPPFPSPAPFLSPRQDPSRSSPRPPPTCVSCSSNAKPPPPLGNEGVPAHPFLPPILPVLAPPPLPPLSAPCSLLPAR